MRLGELRGRVGEPVERNLAERVAHVLSHVPHVGHAGEVGRRDPGPGAPLLLLPLLPAVGHVLEQPGAVEHAHVLLLPLDLLRPIQVPEAFHQQAVTRQLLGREDARSHGCGADGLLTAAADHGAELVVDGIVGVERLAPRPLAVPPGVGGVARHCGLLLLQVAQPGGVLEGAHARRQQEVVVPALIRAGEPLLTVDRGHGHGGVLVPGPRRRELVDLVPEGREVGHVVLAQEGGDVVGVGRASCRAVLQCIQYVFRDVVHVGRALLLVPLLLLQRVQHVLAGPVDGPARLDAQPLRGKGWQWGQHPPLIQRWDKGPIIVKVRLTVGVGCQLHPRPLDLLSSHPHG
mmetsp:Transcript_23578/g.50445  ORF Transcript_23578/g.50445 Transcript_23578/m.50445 type:complete len:346 (-) Transcript_23578:140-1177(-)